MRMIPAVGTGALAALILGAMPGCASLGGPYPEVIAETGAPPQGHARIVLLRPNQRFDNASLSRVVIRVNDEVLGKLAYGGFLFVDVDKNETILEASARNRWYGSCKLQVAPKAGETIYVDVAPRPVNVAAEIVGAVAGAAVVGAGSAGHAGMDEILMEKGAAEVAVASTAGGAAASAIESAGKECGGPYRLKPVAASAALETLERLRWSR
jgi:hypothetical protein